MARAAVEMGGWALWATRERTSLARLLGGTRDTVATGISIGIQDTPDALVQKAQAALAAGYRKIKIKIRPGADIEYVAAVREALGPGRAADGRCQLRLYLESQRSSGGPRPVPADDGSSSHWRTTTSVDTPNCKT